MRRFADWTPWGLDIWTYLWGAWILYFIIVETLAGLMANRHGDLEMLTNHLRPVFLSVPVVWWVAFGLWLWIGVHLLAPTLEEWIFQAVRG